MLERFSRDLLKHIAVKTAPGTVMSPIHSLSLGGSRFNDSCGGACILSTRGLHTKVIHQVSYVITRVTCLQFKVSVPGDRPRPGGGERVVSPKLPKLGFIGIQQPPPPSHGHGCAPHSPVLPLLHARRVRP